MSSKKFNKVPETVIDIPAAADGVTIRQAVLEALTTALSAVEKGMSAPECLARMEEMFPKCSPLTDKEGQSIPVSVKMFDKKGVQVCVMLRIGRAAPAEDTAT